jgi:hypothetical protein
VDEEFWDECSECETKVSNKKLKADVKGYRKQAKKAKKDHRETKHELERLKHAWSVANDEMCQEMGKALGFPWFYDDQESFPGSTAENGVCIGDHVAESLVTMVVRRMQEAETELASVKSGGECDEGVGTPSGGSCTVWGVYSSDSWTTTSCVGSGQTTSGSVVQTREYELENLRASFKGQRDALLIMEEERNDALERAEKLEYDLAESVCIIDELRRTVKYRYSKFLATERLLSDALGENDFMTNEIDYLKNETIPNLVHDLDCALEEKSLKGASIGELVDELISRDSTKRF